MHSHKAVRTRKPISKSLYTDKTEARTNGTIYSHCCNFSLIVVFFATIINTVFTDEVMQFALRGHQQEASERHY